MIMISYSNLFWDLFHSLKLVAIGRSTQMSTTTAALILPSRETQAYNTQTSKSGSIHNH